MKPPSNLDCDLKELEEEFLDSPFQRIDGELAKYYASCGRNDYFDEKGVGKFMQFVQKHEFDENAIDLELGDDVKENESLFIEMDPSFPVKSTPAFEVTDKSRNDAILKVLKHCYKYGLETKQAATSQSARQMSHDHRHDRNNSHYDELIAKLRKELAKKSEEFDKQSDELDKTRKKLDKLHKKLPGTQRENQSPLAILLTIDNDRRLSKDVLDILENGLSIDKQCMMLLHKSDYTVNKNLNEINTLQPNDKKIIKSVITDYHAISERVKSADLVFFLFYIIAHSVEHCGRIEHFVKKEYWQCVHYLVMFMLDHVLNFEDYIDRYKTDKLPGSIIDGVCRKYDNVFYSHDFKEELRALKDVIYSYANRVCVIHSKNIIKEVKELNALIEELRSEMVQKNDTIKGLKKELAEKGTNVVSVSDNKSIKTDTNDTDSKDIDDGDEHEYDGLDEHDRFALSKQADELLDKDYLPTIAERCDDEDDDDVISRVEVMTMMNEVDRSKYSADKPPPQNQNECEIEEKSIAKSRVNKYIAPKIKRDCYYDPILCARVNAACDECFDSNKACRDFLISNNNMEYNDGHISADNMLVSLGVHCNGQMLYGILENDPFKNRMKCADFRTASQLQWKFPGIKLPNSCRNVVNNWFDFASRYPPTANCLSINIFSNDALCALRSKHSMNPSNKHPHFTMTTDKLKPYLYNKTTGEWKWNNRWIVPIVYTKGKKSRIEWVRFFSVGGGRSIGVSFWFNRPSRKWQFGCIHTDAVRLYRQHCLVSLDPNHRYHCPLHIMKRYITASIKIIQPH